LRERGGGGGRRRNMKPGLGRVGMGSHCHCWTVQRRPTFNELSRIPFPFKNKFTLNLIMPQYAENGIGHSHRNGNGTLSRTDQLPHNDNLAIDKSPKILKRAQQILHASYPFPISPSLFLTSHSLIVHSCQNKLHCCLFSLPPGLTPEATHAPHHHHLHPERWRHERGIST
jgi:hypothetical protein